MGRGQRGSEASPWQTPAPKPNAIMDEKPAFYPTVYPVIDSILCRQCPRCAVSKACRYMAVIRFGPDEPPVIDAARCQRCGACTKSCPYDAVVAV